MRSRKKIMPGTGLAAMLAGFVIYISGIFPAAPAKAYDGPEPESDSVILARHIHETKIHYALEEFSDHSFNSHLTDTEIDSILAESGMSFNGSQVIYSPDSAFKIFVVEGEECVRTCESICESYLHYNDNSLLVNSHTPFSHVRQIALMNDGKYLVISEDYVGKTPNGRSTILSAALISFDGYTILYHHMAGDSTIGDAATSPHNFFSCGQNSRYDNPLTLQFDQATQQLKYSYVYNAGDRSGEEYLYEGSLNYTGGGFQQGPESKRIYPQKK